MGTLKAIDSETATVSLQDVQCHGTEGRKGNPAEEMAGSDTVYEGIVFRGSDVKDLTILAPPKENRPPQQIPNDPAILNVRKSLSRFPPRSYDEISLDVKKQFYRWRKNHVEISMLPSF